MIVRHRVSKDVMKKILIAKGVIEEVRRLLPHGAGNQKIHQSVTNGWAQYLTDMAQAAADINNQWTRPSRVAGAYVKYGAGNCQDQAAIAYLLLRERLSKKYEASFCVAPTIHHVFAAIGVPKVDPDDEVVIVDPWPIMAQPVLFKHHFCRKDKGFEVLRHKPCGREGKLDKAIARFEHINFKKDEDYPAYNYQVRTEGNWNHKFCCSHSRIMQYYTEGIGDKVAKFFHKDN